MRPVDGFPLSVLLFTLLAAHRAPCRRSRSTGFDVGSRRKTFASLASSNPHEVDLFPAMRPEDHTHLLSPFILISEVDDGPAFAGHVFQRKYRADAPDFPHHVVAFYKHADHHLVPITYVHFRPWKGNLMLVGGACTDGRGFALMSEEHRALVTRAGGLMAQAQLYGFRKFGPRCDAFGGYCGDPRAWEVDMAVGYTPTPHKHLIVKWHKPLPDARRDEIIRELHAIGPF